MGPSTAMLRPAPRGGSERYLLRIGVPSGLLAIAAVGWWWSVRMAGDMDRMAMHDTLSFGAFIVAWVAMMTAMMFPAISPVVRLYAGASGRHTVAPLPFFVAGYLVMWTAVGVLAYAAWRELEMPIAEGRTWVGNLAGVALIAAAIWQLTPLKAVCLRHCRSPMSFFLRFGRHLERPSGALRAGAMHGAFCVGCCWALMAVLVAVGTMSVAWMIGLAILITLEKNAPYGERIAQVAAVPLAALGLILLFDGSVIADLT